MTLTTNEYEVRIAKRQQLIDMGIMPYASRRDKDQTVWQLIDIGQTQSLRSIDDILTGPQMTYSTAGRLMLRRISGKLSFAQLQDETGTIQLMFEHQHSDLLTMPQTDPQALMGDSNKRFDYRFLDKLVEVGDRVGVKGELFVTHKWELTLFVGQYQLLSKALRPLGDKFHGIWDDQERAYRQRYLDMIFNQETLHRMKFRSQFIRTLREFYRSKWFIEIDCPVLTASASGAAARPFVTHHHDFDMDFYLRICNEIELKKSTVGWLEKVFTIATNFRNEWSDPSHLQEFTMLEHQNVFRSFHEDMQFTEQMFDHLFDTLSLSRTLTVKDKLGQPKEVDFTTPWPKIDYVAGVNQASWLDITTYTIDDADRLRADIRSKDIEFEGMDKMGTMTLIDYLYKKVLRPTIDWPAFIYNYPSIIAPLARITDENPHKCEKWQVVVNGREIINSYGELVDPIRQRENFAEQSKAEDWWDAEATSADLEFVKVMEYGMPIQAGFGMGIDRIITLLTQQDNLRDVIMFPLMKPEGLEKLKIETIDLSDKNKEPLILNVRSQEWWDAIMSGIKTIETRVLNPEEPERYFGDIKIWDTITLYNKNTDEKMDVRVKKIYIWKDFDAMRIDRHLLYKIYSSAEKLATVTGPDTLRAHWDSMSPGYTKKAEKNGIIWFEIEFIKPIWSADYNYCVSSSTVQIAQSIAKKYLSSTLLHCQQVAHCMKYFAKKLNKSEAEQNYRYIVGLLHDVDWDVIQKDPTKHLGSTFENIMQEIDLESNTHMISDIRSHYPEVYKDSKYTLDSDVRRYLISIDELSGLMYAYARMRGWSFEDMDVSGVVRKIKDTRFAAGVSRDHVRYCEKVLNIRLEDFISDMIQALIWFEWR